MRKTVMITSLLLISAALFPQPERKLVILHANDLHSRLTGYAPESAYTPLTINDDRTVGGFARIATVIMDEKRKNTGTTIVVDGGDFLMGTLFHHLEPTTGFQLPLMKEMGFDAACLGNHEFDFGPGKLAEIINSSRLRGEIPSLLLGNAIFDRDDPADDSLEELVNRGIIRETMIIEKEGLKIGFFSIFGKVADHDAPYAVPVKFEKQKSAARRLVQELKNENCDIIICLSHSGIQKNRKGEYAGEDIDLARSVKGIDVIISGHTHTLLEQPLTVNGVKIVQTGDYGRFVGRMELTIRDRNVILDNYRLIPIDDRTLGENRIHDLIEAQKIMVTQKVLSPLGYDFTSPVAENDFSLGCDEYGNVGESNLGPLIADAIHYYVNRHSKAGTDVSMVAVGVIRDSIVIGTQTAPDIFRVMSLGSGKDEVPGYPLSRLYVTGRELKTVLEILLVASKSTPAYHCFYSGLRVNYNPSKGLLRKIRSTEILMPDGTSRQVSFSKKDTELYSLTANSYMLEFIGIIKKMSFGLINVVPKDAEGRKVTDMKTTVIDMNDHLDGVQEGKEWLALMEYLGSMRDTNGNGIPDIDRKYSSAVRTFFPEGN
ncbi:MAG: bifunctional metallophosphatase/5'-nucleotidase [Bacteroidales bacterium]|nr:bifunctional metallophosphatase/5'-nucleotidase [Bacteroidales bacterium]